MQDLRQRWLDHLAENPAPESAQTKALITPQYARLYINRANTEPFAQHLDLGCFTIKSTYHVQGERFDRTYNATSDPYMKIKWKLLRTGERQYPFVGNITLHHLSLIAHNRGPEACAINQTNGLQVSHLCHQTRCLNPAHLVVETGELNRVCSSVNFCPYTFTEVS